MKCKKIKVLKCVPQQLCPKCNGNGTTSTYNPLSTGMYTTNVCDLCSGTMVIPYAVIPEKQ